MIPHFSSHLASVDRRMVTAVFRVALSLLLLLCVSRFAVSQFEIGAVRGTVSNSTGAPIKEVVVTARTSDSKFSVTATTDESGAYAFSNLPPGTITLLARMPGLQVIYSGLAFPIRQYESWQQNFLMNPASSITLSGSVVDPRGAKIPGVLVTATNADTHTITQARTEDDGIYKFPNLPAGVYTVGVTLQGFRTSTESDVQLGSGATILNFTLTLTTGSGSCTRSPDGTPLPLLPSPDGTPRQRYECLYVVTP